MQAALSVTWVKELFFSPNGRVFHQQATVDVNNVNAPAAL
jgi:hypothetical protein